MQTLFSFDGSTTIYNSKDEAIQARNEMFKNCFEHNPKKLDKIHPVYGVFLKAENPGVIVDLLDGKIKDGKLLVSTEFVFKFKYTDDYKQELIQQEIKDKVKTNAKIAHSLIRDFKSKVATGLWCEEILTDPKGDFNELKEIGYDFTAILTNKQEIIQDWLTKLYSACEVVEINKYYGYMAQDTQKHENSFVIDGMEKYVDGKLYNQRVDFAYFN